MLTPNQRFSNVAHAVRTGGAVLTLCVVAAVCLGWRLDSVMLTRGAPGLVAMNPLTAVCFAFCACALLARGKPPGTIGNQLPALLAGLVVVGGLSRLLGYLTSWDPALDGVLFASKLTGGPGLPNRMAPNTALNFCLIGVALGGRARLRPAVYQALVLGAALTSFIVLLGYAYSASSLLRVGTFIPMALHTALLFLVVSASALCDAPEHGVVSEMLSSTPGGRVVRRLFPALIVGPPLLGWLRLQGELTGLYSSPVGIALTVGSMVAMGLVLTFITARAVDRSDAERRRADEITVRLAHFDYLTGLANRTLFNDRLQQALARAVRAKGQVGLLFLDLDGFKQVNDSLGHEAGDTVLKEAARRIRAALRATDTAARFGGDEFTVIVEQVGTREDIEAVAHRILLSLSNPFEVAETQASLSASVGVSLFPEDSELPDQLLVLADTAMYHAKRAGKNQIAFHRARSAPPGSAGNSGGRGTGKDGHGAR